MKTTRRGADYSLPQRIYERTEDLKAKGLRSGDAIAIVAAQLGKSQGAAARHYYAHRRELAAVSQVPEQVAKQRGALAEQMFTEVEAIRLGVGMVLKAAIEAVAEEHGMSWVVVRCYYDAHKQRPVGPTDAEMAQAQEVARIADRLMC